MLQVYRNLYSSVAYTVYPHICSSNAFAADSHSCSCNTRTLYALCVLHGCTRAESKIILTLMLVILYVYKHIMVILYVTPSKECHTNQRVPHFTAHHLSCSALRHLTHTHTHTHTDARRYPRLSYQHASRELHTANLSSHETKHQAVSIPCHAADTDRHQTQVGPAAGRHDDDVDAVSSQAAVLGSRTATSAGSPHAHESQQFPITSGQTLSEDGLLSVPDDAQAAAVTEIRTCNVAVTSMSGSVHDNVLRNSHSCVTADGADNGVLTASHNSVGDAEDNCARDTRESARGSGASNHVRGTSRNGDDDDDDDDDHDGCSQPNAASSSPLSVHKSSTIQQKPGANKVRKAPNSRPQHETLEAVSCAVVKPAESRGAEQRITKVIKASSARFSCINNNNNSNNSNYNMNSNKSNNLHNNSNSVGDSNSCNSRKGGTKTWSFREGFARTTGPVAHGVCVCVWCSSQHI